MRIWLVVTLALVGCGDNLVAVDARGSDEHPDAAASFGSRMPQDYAQDPTDIMLAPKGMAITWDNDPLRTDLEKFFGEYGASSAWATQTGEYGIGVLTATTPQHMTGNAPGTTTSSDLLSLLTTNLTGATPLWGAPDENTIYMFFIPKGTTVNDGPGNVSCTDYDGYHFDTMIGGVDVAYAISAVCDDEAVGEGITDLQDVTITAGHETLEASTDPRTAFVDNIGWGQVDDAHSAWTYVTEGELADLCEYADTQDWVSPPNMDYSIQRTWSNRAAAAGHDPCVGDPTTPYAQTIPEDPDAGAVNFEGVAENTSGTKLAVGATGTINLVVYADVSTAGPFTVTVYDYDGTYDDQGNDTDPLLTFVEPTGTFNPGDKISVSVTVKKIDQYVTGAEPYEIDTAPINGGPTTYWYGWIVQ